MNLAWLEELLPAAMASPRTKYLSLVFLLLFPLAYSAGVWLERSEESPARMMGYEDRAASIRTAQAFAESKGYPVAGWHQYAIVESKSNLLAYYGDAADPQLAAVNVVAPAREVQVLFRSPDQTHEFRTYLSLAGHVAGYDFGKSSSGNADFTSDLGLVQVHSDASRHSDDDDSGMKNAMTLSERESEAIARKALSENTPLLTSLVKLGDPDISSNDQDSARKQVVWEASPANRPELTLKVTVAIRDSQVVAQHVEATVDKQHAAHKRYLPLALVVLYSFFLTFGAIYAIYRYTKRTLQKEVSHLRTLVVGVLFAISFGVLTYSLAYDQVAVRVSGEIFQQVSFITYVASSTSFLIMGLLVGIGYGSGEGEVREAYPGKLTSLDALLAGRLLSQDVAASLLFGIAAAGWLFFCHRVLSGFVSHDVVATRNDVMTYTFARLPWLTLLVGKQYDSLLIAVTGLLLPSAFLSRSGVKKRRRFFWLIAFAVFAVLQDASKYPTFGSELLATAIFVCALLLPFFAFDLLTAIVSLSALQFVDELARLSAVFPSWSGLAAMLAAVVIVLLVAATYLALRGRRVREESVRPVYAKNLAERMSLQAEVLAAREAQLRLLPQSAPQLPGVEFAACCLPAHGVGGDFYDFFRLDANRIGIFVAQGGEQGLASALRIALAKGVLMHASQQPRSPVEIIAGLEASITELLEGGIGAGISFAYGVIDARRRLLTYARIGSSPRFVVYRPGAGLLTASQIERPVMLPGRARNAAPIYEGTTHAASGDFLIFFTQGVTSLRVRRFGRREFQWVELLMRSFVRLEEPLQTLLTTTMSKQQSHANADLTAVVMRMVESRSAVKEEVA